MKKISYISVILVGLCQVHLGTAQKKTNDQELVRQGNGYYKQGDYENARKKYDAALKKNQNNTKAGFNKGDALYRMKKYNEAGEQFSKQAESTKTPASRAKAFHNLGNSYLQQKDYSKAIDAYKNALRQNPNDESTRYNLAYALKKQKQQQKNQNQNKDKNQDKNKEQNDKSNQKDKKDNQNNDKQNKEDGKNKDKLNEGDNEKKDEQPKPNENQDMRNKPEKPDRMKARQMLEAAEENEKATRAKIYGGNKQKVKPRSGKDW